MKLLVFSNADGNFDYINHLLNNDEIEAGICLGDMCLYSSSTPLRYFLRSKFHEYSKTSIEKNKTGFSFVKPIFGIYGDLDDPFIPANEFRINNLFMHWQLLNEFLGHNEDRTLTKKVRIGFLGGYYNHRKFTKFNTRRAKMSRERQSLALCENDFKLFNNNKLDILFVHDSPSDMPYSNDPNISFGCKQISDLISKTDPKLVIFGHHRLFSINPPGTVSPKIFGMPDLSNGHAILDIFNQKLTFNININPNNGIDEFTTYHFNYGE